MYEMMEVPPGRDSYCILHWINEIGQSGLTILKSMIQILTAFKSWLCWLLVIDPWVSLLTSMSLRIIYKIRI